LRSRLARLPDGHPSSPYDDGGQFRPFPIRLRQLELGLPPPWREPIGTLTPPTAAAANSAPHREHDLAADSREDPDPDPAQLDPALGEMSPAVGDTERDEQPHRSGWGDPYASGNGRPSGDRPADLSLGPWQASEPPRVSGLAGLSGGGRNGHSRVNGRGGPPPRGTEAERRDTAERPILEPPDALQLPAELRALVDGTLATSKTAEGRNVFGGYGNSGLTPAIQRIVAQLRFGGLAPDSEINSLKSPARFAAKLARLIARYPGRTPMQLAEGIGDAVRYAFVFDAADYVAGTWLVHRRLKSHGFELEIRRNRWESPEYKGIFTQWRDPAHDLAFEVQFHTPASWTVVQRTHEAYVQITDPATSPAERARLRARQVAASADATAPPDWGEIADFRLEPR
jgi:hypothetical protein